MKENKLLPEIRIYRTYQARVRLYEGNNQWARFNIWYLTGQFRDYE